MAFAIKLFRIQLQHTYYHDQVCDDFGLVPHGATRQWMDRYGMRLKAQPGSFELLWVTHRMKDPLQVFQGKIYDTTLSFQMLLKHPGSAAYSQFSVVPDHAYHLTNTPDSPYLHKGPYLSEEDKIAVTPQRSYMYKLARSTWGVIHIDLERLWDTHMYDPEKVPVDYTIRIKAQEAIWRYRVIKKKSSEKIPASIVLQGKDDYFNKREEKGPEGEEVSVYESVAPMALRDKPRDVCSLRGYLKREEGEEVCVLVEALPLPNASSLKRDTDSGKLYFDEVVIHV